MLLDLQQPPHLIKHREAPKKKKASRACLHCQKAHVTCDDGRPCGRCIKRGHAHTCVNGHRKKAKYLFGVEDKELNGPAPNYASQNQTPASTRPHTPTTPEPSNLSQATGPIFVASGQMTPNGGDLNHQDTAFDYSMFEALVGSTGPLTTSTVFETTSHSANSENPFRYPKQEWSEVTRVIDALQPTSLPLSGDTSSYPSSPSQKLGSPFSIALPPSIWQSAQDSRPPTSESDDAASCETGSSSQDNFSSGSLPTSGILDPTNWLLPREADKSIQPTSNALSVYRQTTSGYDYTKGYHHLMDYLQNGNLHYEDTLRVARALALYRPSILALQAPLTEEDDIFVEKCFQRSLLELEKMITMTGTPTAVWRRTGEVCLVSLEFSLLTEWAQSEFEGEKKFIYELFESQSVVDYWENFAAHAFESATPGVSSHCILVKPNGQKIPCTFCFTIRRDIFDLPYAIIGQWLPLF